MTHGGAIAHLQGATVISGSVFFGNEATYGGAIDARSGGSLHISDSQFRSNRAGWWGGALSIGVYALVVRSTFSNNRAGVSDIGGGGAIHTLSASAARLELYQSVLFDNQSDNDGGALLLAGGFADLATVTLSGNYAQRDGGALMITGTVTADLRNATVANNTADSDLDHVGLGGGIRVFTGTLKVRNSIVAGNTDNSVLLGNTDCAGRIQSQGYNLIRDTSGCTIGGAPVGDLYGKDPLLAPLADNGGPTKTHALLPGSPAIDTGDTDASSCYFIDQRGVRRPIGPHCDIGAFEAPLWLYLPFVRR
jgi:hypothetical protein